MLVALFDRILNLANYSPSTGWADNAALSSPWATGLGLQSIIMPEAGKHQVTIAMALSVPPVTRAMFLYSTVIADLQLVTEDGDAPAWMNNTFDAITPSNRLAGMVQDLVFFGRTCLIVDRDGDGIRDALRMPTDLWDVDWLGQITVNGETEYDQSQFIYIESLMPQGFLEYAAESIAEYRALRRTIKSRMDNPIPLVELKVTTDFEGTAEELKAAQDDWSNARQAPNGAVAITPLGIDLTTHTPGNSDDELLIAARNAIRLDMANFLNINAAMLDGNNGTSDTYSNTLQNKNELLTLSVQTWLTPIAARFSQPDIIGDGPAVKFDTSTFDTGGDTAGTAVGSTQADAAANDTMSADDLVKLVNAAAALIRSGFDPVDALVTLGLDPIKHLGLLPVTVQKPVEPDGTEDGALVDDLTEGEPAHV